MCVCKYALKCFLEFEQRNASFCTFYLLTLKQFTVYLTSTIKLKTKATESADPTRNLYVAPTSYSYSYSLTWAVILTCLFCLQGK